MRAPTVNRGLSTSTSYTVARIQLRKAMSRYSVPKYVSGPFSQDSSNAPVGGSRHYWGGSQISTKPMMKGGCDRPIPYSGRVAPLNQNFTFRGSFTICPTLPQIACQSFLGWSANRCTLADPARKFGHMTNILLANAS